MNCFDAIADPTRRRIVELLARRDLTVGEIVAQFDMSAPAISQHLKVLRDAGLVSSRIEAQSRIQTLNTQALEPIRDWLSTTLDFWSQRLDALEMALREDDLQPSRQKTLPEVMKPAKKISAKLKLKSKP